MEKTIKINKINSLTYESGGVTIIFRRTEPTKSEIIPKFTFFIEGNDELTKQILASIVIKKVREKNIYSWAEGLFRIIEGKNPKSAEPERKIVVSSAVAPKGSGQEECLKINLIHLKGAYTRNFVLYGSGTFGPYEDWRDIFYSNLQKKYSDFLRQFGVEVPKSLISNINETELELVLSEFSTQFDFYTKP
jgi:hypothetical protein